MTLCRVTSVKLFWLGSGFCCFPVAFQAVHCLGGTCACISTVFCSNHACLIKLRPGILILQPVAKLSWASLAHCLWAQDALIGSAYAVAYAQTVVTRAFNTVWSPCSCAGLLGKALPCTGHQKWPWIWIVKLRFARLLKAWLMLRMPPQGSPLFLLTGWVFYIDVAVWAASGYRASSDNA